MIGCDRQLVHHLSASRVRARQKHQVRKVTCLRDDNGVISSYQWIIQSNMHLFFFNHYFIQWPNNQILSVPSGFLCPDKFQFFKSPCSRCLLMLVECTLIKKFARRSQGSAGQTWSTIETLSTPSNITSFSVAMVHIIVAVVLRYLIT